MIRNIRQLSIRGFKLICNHRKGNMSKSDKILTPEYLDWHAKLTGLPSVLTDKIRSKLYKKYKKETGHEPWQHASEARLLINLKPENKVSYLSFSEKCELSFLKSNLNYQNPS